MEVLEIQLGEHTIEDIEALPQGERAELIDGEIFMMSTPGTNHQDLVGGLYAEIRSHIRSKKKPCHVFIAPVTVFLDAKKTKRHWYEPDVFVVCDKEKIQKDGIYGAPDLVIEVLSPGTASKDRFLKAYMYEKYGVKEYWIVSPDEGEVIVNLFSRDSEPRISTYSFEEEISPSLYPDLKMKIADLLL